MTEPLPEVAFFVDSMDAAGGVERSMANLATALDERSWSVEFVSGEFNGPFVGRLSKGVNQREINLIDAPLARQASIVASVRRYLNRRQPEVFVTAMNHINVLALVGKKLATHTPNLVVTEHNDPELLVSEHNPARRYDDLIYRLAAIFYPGADSVVAVSEGVAEGISEVVGLSRDSIEVIYNPVVDDDVFESARECPDHPWFDSDDDVLLAVKPTEQKNIPLAVSAISEIEGVRLIVAGSGDRAEQVRQRATRLGVNDRVDVVGYVENIYAYMSSADAFVLTSNYEGLANVLIESMACGTPVVSTNCPSGPAEILEDGRYGELVEPGDASAVAAGVRRTLENPPEPEFLKRRAERFSVDRAANRYDTLLNRLTEHD